jgi:Raf kinase inhibitor-like YbhB/YbcL family protein
MVHLFVALALVLAVSSCQKVQESDMEKPEKIQPAAETQVQALELRSTAFEQDSVIPKKHTCDGEDVSPALFWSGIPEGTKSLALVCDDPDAPAGIWVHWVLYGIPAGTDSLPEALPKTDLVMEGVKQGMTSFRRVGYGGPCPPKGKPHRYFFKLYALDKELELEAGKTKDEILEAIKGHILTQAELMGKYGR